MLNRRYDLAYAIIRYLTSVLAAECLGLALEPARAPAALHALLGKLESPAWGHFVKAAEALARVVLSAGKPLVAPEVARLFFERGPRGELIHTPFAKDLIRFVEIRNDSVHPDLGGCMPLEDRARQQLVELEAPLRHVLRELHHLQRLPLLYVDHVEEGLDGSRRGRLLRFCGTDIEMLELDLRGAETLPAKIPFLLSEAGDVLLLAPFVEIDIFPGTTTLSARLLADWRPGSRQAGYSDPQGGLTAAHFGKHWPPAPLEWLAQPPSFSRRDRAVPEQLIAALRQPGREEAIPEIAGYVVESFLGRGSGGRVFLAREHTEHGPGPRVAIKLLSAAISEKQEKRLRREFELMRQLEHPGIVRMLDFVPDSASGPFLVMEYVEGEDLDTLVAARPRSPDEAATICEHVLHALAAVHGKDITHRDVKPCNVIIDRRNGRARLLDFGIAYVDGGTRLTGTMDAVGTPGYASPEQLDGLDVTPAADLFAVGRLLEFLITGVAPGSGERPSLPPGIAAIVRKATQHDPGHRYQRAEQMLAAISERRDAAWRGAPVGRDDVLTHSYELHRLLGPVAEGLHLFRAAEIATDEPVGIVIADRGGSGERRLREVVAAATDDLRASVRYRGLQRSSDALVFAVLGGGEALTDRSLSFLSLRPYRRTDPDVAESLRRNPWVDPVAVELASRQFSIAWRPNPRRPRALAPYLQGFASPQDLRILDVLAITELLGGVIAAQAMGIRAAAHHQRGPGVSELFVLPCSSTDSWRSFSLAVLGQPSFWQETLGLVPAVCELASAAGAELRELQHDRNRIVHGVSAGLDLRAYATRLMALAQKLFDLAADLSAQASIESTWPVLAEMSDGTWAVLTPFATKLVYRALSVAEPGKQYPLPEAVADWAAQSERARFLTNTSIRESRAHQSDARRQQVERVLRRWSAVAAIDHDVALPTRPPRKADVLARDRDGRPLVVIETDLATVERLLGADTTAALGALAGDVGAPYVAATDGTRWRWYRREAGGALVPMRDLAALIAAHATAAPPG